MKSFLCSRNEEANPELHIYINSDKFTNENNTIVVSYDNEQLSYSIDLKQESNIEDGLDWLMGLIGRDTQNWFHKDIVIHWGINVWKFFNAKNICDYTKEEYDEFGLDKNDYDNLHS